ncbi:MAG: SIS domain-containing protein [Chloroflexi bacterium]|nr:SIS domain-containing protein [Chloroflexota bacterium]
MVARVETLIDSYLQTLAGVALGLPRDVLERAADLLYECWRREGTVFVIGNGGSASTATHLACDLAKGTIVPGRRRLRALSLADNVPLVSAWTNDGGFGGLFAEQLEPWISADDALVVLSVHGGAGHADAGPWSQNLLRAAALARQRGARVIGLSGFEGGPLAGLADVAVVVPVEAEPLGTPIVESLHAAICHLLCLALRQRIAEADE